MDELARVMVGMGAVLGILLVLIVNFVTGLFWIEMQKCGEPLFLITVFLDIALCFFGTWGILALAFRG